MIVPAGPIDLCPGECVTLCVEPPFSSVIWNTGSSTPCITVCETSEYFPIGLDSLGNVDSTLIQNPAIVTVHNPNPQMHVMNDSLWVSGEFEAYQWYLDSVAIPNATNWWYVALQSGYYNVEVTDSFGCSGFANYMDFPPQAIEGRENVQFEIFPNPTFSVVKMALTSSSFDRSIAVTDYTGKVHFNQLLPQNQKDFLIDVRHWPNGIHFISLQSEKGIDHTEKLIVQHE